MKNYFPHQIKFDEENNLKNEQNQIEINWKKLKKMKNQEFHFV